MLEAEGPAIPLTGIERVRAVDLVLKDMVDLATDNPRHSAEELAQRAASLGLSGVVKHVRFSPEGIVVN